MSKSKNLHYRKLKNGLQVLYYYEPRKATFYSEAIINSGAAHENLSNSGIAHFVEHILLTSSKKNPTPKKFAKVINKIGGSFNGSTGYDSVTFYGSFPKSEYKKGIDIIYQYLFEPSLEKSVIENQRKVINDEILMTRDNKMREFLKFIYRNRFVDPFVTERIFNIGTEKSLAAITEEDIKNWVKKFYTPNNIILGSTGSVSPEKYFDFVEEKFSSIKPSKETLLQPFSVEATPELSTKKIVVQEDSKYEKAYFAISFPSYNLVDNDAKDFQIFKILKSYIAENEESVLFQELREKYGLVYSVGATSDQSTNYGMWGVSTSFDIKHFKKVIGILKKEFERLVKKKFKKSVLKSLQKYHAKTFMMRYDSHHSMLDWYLIDYFTNFVSNGKTPIESPEEVSEISKKLLVEEIEEKIEDLLDFSKVNIILYGNLGKYDKKKLESDLSSLIVSK